MMNRPYSLDGSSVLYDGREDLHQVEISKAVLHALRRKLRLARYDADFFRNLTAKGEASITWNFTRFNAVNDRAWVTFHAWEYEDEQYHLHCIGPQAEEVIERINKVLYDKTPRQARKMAEQAEREKRSRGRRLTKKQYTRLQKKLSAPEQKKKPPKERHRAKAPISFADHELLTPQFRKSRFLWSEALAQTVAIFEVRNGWKYTAREKVARELWSSLDRSGFRFAQYKRSGFCLRFDLVDCVWRGDITPLTVSCTKDNKHPTYRKMRNCLKDRILGLSSKEQRTRVVLLWPEECLVA